MKRLIRFLLLVIFVFILIWFITIYYPHMRPTNILRPTSSVKIELNYNKVYLAINESKEITSNQKDISWSSEDELVATVNDGVITGVSAGKTLINASIGKSKASVEVVVTDLITLPTLNNEKDFLTCNRYSLEESNLLDELLEYRIKEAGIRTRAGAVEAARFLTLEFPYRLTYFLENGRLITAGNRTYCDGEGRYYHKGLYLHESKKQDLIVSNRGPAIWGCDLYNGVEKRTLANGLDCSGFVSWALLNAGYSPGDGGAGITELKTDMDDLGKKIDINQAIKNNDGIKVGNLMSRYGHIGIIIGINGDTIYIAEALDEDLHVLVQNKKDLSKKWTYIIDMDEFYIEDGNLTDMW
ncbi:MAG: hypothetical protein J5982_00210 [Bacilli bacterium]|nr:hypothetical protein [Bacilli bacterium]